LVTTGRGKLLQRRGGGRGPDHKDFVGLNRNREKEVNITKEKNYQTLRTKKAPRGRGPSKKKRKKPKTVEGIRGLPGEGKGGGE